MRCRVDVFADITRHALLSCVRVCRTLSALSSTTTSTYIGHFKPVQSRLVAYEWWSVGINKCPNKSCWRAFSYCVSKCFELSFVLLTNTHWYVCFFCVPFHISIKYSCSRASVCAFWHFVLQRRDNCNLNKVQLAVGRCASGLEFELHMTDRMLLVGLDAHERIVETMRY